MHIVKINLYENLNMDYMFEDIKDLISVEMKSNNICQILSMIGTFKNCIKLNDFNISGFNLEKVSSMRYLFYNSSLSTFFFSAFNVNNIKDISYMFANTSIKEI